MVTLTDEEFDALTPEQRSKHLAQEEMTVFGRTKLDEPAFKRVDGRPVEMGIGAVGRESINHLAAIRKYEGEEAYQAAVAAIWKRDPAYAEKLGLPKRRAS